MSEENQDVQSEAEVTEAPQVAPESVEVVEESLEAKVTRYKSERDDARAKAEKTQKGLLKVKRKGQSRADAIAQERDQYKNELHEYKGTQAELPPQPTAQDHERLAVYKVRCDDLIKDEDFLKLHNERAREGTNPFVENNLIDKTLAQRGIDPSIATYILTDADLCERLGDADDPFEVVALVEVAKDRAKSKKVEAPVKVTKPVNAPKTTPTQKTNNTASTPVITNQSTEDWYAQQQAKQR